MKLTWICVIILLVFVALFIVQNAEPITVRWLGWQASVSAALVIQLSALLGGLVGLTAGAWSRRGRSRAPHEATVVATPGAAGRSPDTLHRPEAR